MRVKIDSMDIVYAALIIACAWGKLSWWWFWGVLIVGMLVEHFGGESDED